MAFYHEPLARMPHDSQWVGGVPESIFTIPEGTQLVRGRSGAELLTYVTENCVDISDANEADKSVQNPHFIAELLHGQPDVMEFSVRTKMPGGESHPDLFAGRLLVRSIIHFELARPVQTVHARWHEDSVNYEQYTDALENFAGVGSLDMIRKLAAKETWTANVLAQIGFRRIVGEVIETETYEGKPMVNATFARPGGRP